MAISTPIQTKSVNAGAVNSSGLAFTTNNVAGNLLICCVRYGPNSVTVSVSDSQGNTWQEAPGADFQGANNGVWIFYAANCAAGANTVTVTGGGTATTLRFSIAEYSGADTTSPWDVSSTATGTGTLASLPITTLSDGSLIVIVTGSSAASVASAGSGQYTVEEALNSLFAFTDGFGVTAGAETGLVNLATSVTWLGAIAAFKPQVVAAPAPIVPNTTHRLYEYTYQC